MIAVTPDKLAANQLNAQKSTGPKTAQGKAAACRNALKHGAFARSLLVRSLHLKESPKEFHQLCHEFHASLAPVGQIETMLVDQLIQITWRLRRAHRAEAGEIALSIDGGRWQRDNLDAFLPHRPAPLHNPSAPAPIDLDRSTVGCLQLLSSLIALKNFVKHTGELTESALQDYAGMVQDSTAACLPEFRQLRDWFVNNPEKLEPKPLRALHRRQVLHLVKRAMHPLAGKIRECGIREAAEEKARQSAAVLPPAPTLDRILRYEAALERQLFRTLNQLDRLQHRRQAQNPPTPPTPPAPAVPDSPAFPPETMI